MSITVEFFGVPRARAGVPKTSAEGACLGDVLADLSSRFPGLASGCIDGDKLRAGYVANLAGDRFVVSPETVLRDGDVVLLMSLDAGG